MPTFIEFRASRLFEQRPADKEKQKRAKQENANRLSAPQCQGNRSAGRQQVKLPAACREAASYVEVAMVTKAESMAKPSGITP